MKFELGKTYPMHGGGSGTVTEIHRDHMMVSHDDEGGMEYFHRLDGSFWNTDPECPWHLLPAIEAEGAPAKKVNRLSNDTFEALARYSAFWTSFIHGIQSGDINPCNGARWKCPEGGYISCTYLTSETALTEASAVIAAINSLLEGAAK